MFGPMVSLLKPLDFMNTQVSILSASVVGARGAGHGATLVSTFVERRPFRPGVVGDQDVGHRLDRPLSALVMGASMQVTDEQSELAPKDVGCLGPSTFLTLVSEAGFHCDVWQTHVRRQVDDIHSVFDLVIKCHRGACGRAYARALQREHGRLRRELSEIVPPALFVATRIDGEESVVVVSDSCHRWFNPANPVYHDDLVPMLERMPRARDQMRRFVRAAITWRDASDSRIIDLVGEDNLVLTTSRELRYIDSFDVFFYPDILDLLDDRDFDLERRMDMSLERLTYLEAVCREVGAI